MPIDWLQEELIRSLGLLLPSPRLLALKAKPQHKGIPFSLVKKDLLILESSPMVKSPMPFNSQDQLLLINYKMESQLWLNSGSETKQRNSLNKCSITVAVKVGSRQETVANSSVAQFVSRVALKVWVYII